MTKRVFAVTRLTNTIERIFTMQTTSKDCHEAEANQWVWRIESDQPMKDHGFSISISPTINI